MLLSVVLRPFANREDMDLLENSREQWDTWLEKNKCQNKQDGRVQTNFLCFLTRKGALLLCIFKKVSHLQLVIRGVWRLPVYIGCSPFWAGGVMEFAVQDVGPFMTAGLFSQVPINSFTPYTQNQIGKGVIIIILVFDIGIEF